MNANSKNPWNVIAVCCVKQHVDKHVWYIIINEYTDASIFVQFVAYLNVNIENKLLLDFKVLLIALLPYRCDLNPTEFIFNTIVARMKSERARYNALSNDDFYNNIDNEIRNFSLSNVKSFSTS